MPAPKPPAPPPDLFQQSLTFIEANPTVVVGAFGIIVTIILFWFGYQRNRIEATFKALELLQEKDVRDARFGLRDMMRGVVAKGDGYSSLSAEDRAKLSSIVLSFGFIGALGRRNRIDLRIFLDAFASSVMVNHERLRDYTAWRDSYRSVKDGTLWKDFDWLAHQAHRYLAIRADPNPLRRLACRMPFVPPNWSLMDALIAEARDPLPLTRGPAVTPVQIPVPTDQPEASAKA
jgi:hypothetical protein